MTRFRLERYLAFRLPIVVVVALSALLWQMGRRPAAELGAHALDTTGELGWRMRAAEYLSRVQGVWVAPETVHFLPLDLIPSWYEAFHFVPVVFTAIPVTPPVEVPLESQWADLFYAEIAMNADGVPIDSRRFSNVSRTPAADETVVAAWGPIVVVSSRIAGRIDAVRLLDFRGDARAISAEGAASRTSQQLASHLENLGETGRWNGVGQRCFLVTVPTDELEAKLAGDRLRIWLEHRGTVRGEAELDLSNAALVQPAEGFEPQAYSEGQPPDLSSALSDELRRLPWLGPHRVDVADATVNRLSDQARQRLHQWLGSPPLPSVESVLGSDASAARIAVPPSDLPESEEWPPDPIAPLGGFDELIRGEGRWLDASPEWLRPLPNAPPAFLRTFLRADPHRPYDAVLILAVDLRQIDLRYQQGTDEPASSTGRQGTGLIPRDRDTLERLVAAFNGGPRAMLAPLGSVVDGDVFLEPVDGASTILWTDRDDAVHLGEWSHADELPGGTVTLRQSLSTNGAETEPSQRTDPAPRTEIDLATARSGLCFAGEHTLMYFWSAESTRNGLARAMAHARCDFEMQLDAGDDRDGWAFYRVDDLDREEYRASRPATEMALPPDRFLRANRRDFFYLLLRDTFDHRLPPLEGTRWEASGMPTTADGFLPVAARLRIEAGAVRMIALDARLLRPALSLGRDEPTPPPEPSRQRYRPAAVTEPRLLATFDATDVARPRGLTVRGSDLSPTRGEGVWLVISKERLRVVRGVDPAVPTRVELVDPESADRFAGICSFVAQLPDRDTVVFAWGSIADVRRRLDDLDVTASGLLGCGRHNLAVESLRRNGAGWEATDLLTGDARRLDDLNGSRSRIVLEPRPRDPRVLPL